MATAFTVVANGGASGNALVFTSSDLAATRHDLYDDQRHGTCSVIANQAGNGNYAAAAQVTEDDDGDSGDFRARRLVPARIRRCIASR